jgi:hypothetical protein
MNKNRIEIPLYLKRTNFFAGRILTAADFQAEQSYFRERMRLHNLNCHGSGIVSGLEVSTSEGPARSIIVSPGTALDPLGNEINLFSAVRCPLPQKLNIAYLVLYWAERETDPVPIHENDTGLSMASRVEEYAILQYQTSESPADSHTGIVLARLIKVRRQWKVDQEFQVPRARA